MLYNYFSNSGHLFHIHPDNEDNVRTARENIHSHNATDGTERSEGNQNSSNSFRAQQQDNGGHGRLSCPICLGDMEFGVDTNCGHYYCGQYNILWIIFLVVVNK